MNSQQINQLNHDFYEQIANSFSQTRNFNWAGWELLWPELAKNQIPEGQTHSLKILDVGCGNARLAVFLAQHLAQKEGGEEEELRSWRYFGIDNSPALLQLAQEKIATEIINRPDLPLHPQTSFCLDQVDLNNASQLSQYLQENQPFTAIMVFGVLHHLVNYQTRLQLLTQLGQTLSKSGLLIFSLWQFMNEPRLAKKAQLLPGNHNYLLDWQRADTNQQPPRFCHHFDDQEINQLIEDLKTALPQLKLIKQFKADGPQNNLNAYLVFQFS